MALSPFTGERASCIQEEEQLVVVRIGFGAESVLKVTCLANNLLTGVGDFVSSGFVPVEVAHFVSSRNSHVSPWSGGPKSV